MNTIKEGMILTAIDCCEMKHDKKKALVVGKDYEVLSVGQHLFEVKSEVDDFHNFEIDNIEKYFKIKTNDT